MNQCRLSPRHRPPPPRLPRPHLHYHPSIDSTMTAAAAPPHRRRRPRRRADRRTRPPRPLLAFRPRRRHLLLRRPPPDPLLTLALGLATHSSHRRSHRTDLRPSLAQRPHARRPQSRRHPRPGSPTAAPSPVSASTSTTPLSLTDLAARATSLRIAAGRPLSREDILLALLPAIDTVVRRGQARASSRRSPIFPAMHPACA